MPNRANKIVLLFLLQCSFDTKYALFDACFFMFKVVFAEAKYGCSMVTSVQISELSHVNIPVMLMPDDFKAYTKTRVDNHMFNK